MSTFSILTRQCLELSEICPKCKWNCDHYQSNGFCRCSPYGKRDCDISREQCWADTVINIDLPPNPRLSEVNIIIDGDNFSQRIIVVLIDYFIKQGCKTVAMVISPSKYIGIISGSYGDQVKSDFIRLIEGGHVLVISAANSMYYDHTGGCEDAVVLHIGMYHRAIVLSNDTFKPKIGEEHEFIPNTSLHITETKISDYEISLTFTNPSNLTQPGPDVLNYVIDNVLAQNTPNDPICTSSCIEAHIPEILKRHRIYNLNKHLDRCDRVVYEHYSKLEKYSQKLNTFTNQIDKAPINDMELIETLNERKQQVIENTEEYKDKIASLLEQNEKFREEIIQQLTISGNIDHFKPVSIRSGLPYYIFGSENSHDNDILVLLKDYQKPATYVECQKLMNKFTYEFQDLHCFESDKPININLAVLTDGIITWVLKGNPDEANNGILRTYHLHKQYHSLEIQRLVPRDIEKKIIRATRSILSQLTKSERRHNIKNALKANQLYSRLDALKPICFQELNFKQSEKDLTEIVKLIAFQLGQTMALVKENIELYTKIQVAEYDPRLKQYLMRESGCNLEILTQVKNEYVAMIEHMFVQQPELRTKAEVLVTD
ncbi:unnamed protein product [Adineta steineri]|uniref:Uncharacterized protein n=1 Tax=Adineta steineri TaxID=433720 RepID=A0A815P6I2_9BILA|nr:unnamed protein product [Adineta steineri]CAF3582114.1 unnamed protein product [Adineta steineri]